MRDDMMFCVCLSFYNSPDINFVCKKLSDVDFYIKDQLNENNDRDLKSIVIDLVDFYDPSL